MNDINRLVIFLLLSGLLYALYKYQHLVFGKSDKPLQIEHKKKSIKKDPKYITADNISQVSVQSLENEKGVYKQDSILGSLGDSDNTVMSDVGSLFDDVSKASTQKSDMSQNSNDSLFF